MMTGRPSTVVTVVLTRMRNMPRTNTPHTTTGTITTRSVPLWKGPEVDGITYSMLSRFLQCRERFLLRVRDGLASTDEFNHKIFYGSLWHECMEAYNRSQPVKSGSAWLWQAAVNQAAKEYTKSQCAQYPMSQEHLVHWYNVCLTQFPLYVDFWARRQQVTRQKNILQEQTFNVDYPLPSGRKVKLRGRWDAIVGLMSLATTSRSRSISEYTLYVWENKTKGQIVEGQLKRQLTYDLQTMLYVVALAHLDWSQYGGVLDKVTVDLVKGMKIGGVIYNVVRRPLSGGKGTIRQHKGRQGKKAESKDEYYKRLGGIIESSAEEYFMRWQVEVLPGDLLLFRRDCLDPILENLCYWYDVTVLGTNPGSVVEQYGHPPLHWRHPYGVRNFLDEGGSSDYDEYLASGSMLGLRKIDTLFEELA